MCALLGASIARQHYWINSFEIVPCQVCTSGRLFIYVYLFNISHGLREVRKVSSQIPICIFFFSSILCSWKSASSKNKLSAKYPGNIDPLHNIQWTLAAGAGTLSMSTTSEVQLVWLKSGTVRVIVQMLCVVLLRIWDMFCFTCTTQTDGISKTSITSKVQVIGYLYNFILQFWCYPWFTKILAVTC